MTRQFLRHIFRYAESLKGTSLSDSEERRIVDEFNNASGDTSARARDAVRKALGLMDLVEELRKSANLDSTRRLLQDLQSAAQQWQAKK